MNVLRNSILVGIICFAASTLTAQTNSPLRVPRTTPATPPPAVLPPDPNLFDGSKYTAGGARDRQRISMREMDDANIHVYSDEESSGGQGWQGDGPGLNEEGDGEMEGAVPGPGGGQEGEEDEPGGGGGPVMEGLDMDPDGLAEADEVGALMEGMPADTEPGADSVATRRPPREIALGDPDMGIKVDPRFQQQQEQQSAQAQTGTVVQQETDGQRMEAAAGVQTRGRERGVERGDSVPEGL